MKTVDIPLLLQRFEQGQTTEREESYLKQYFREHKDVPAEWEPYKWLFLSFDSDIYAPASESESHEPYNVSPEPSDESHESHGQADKRNNENHKSVGNNPERESEAPFFQSVTAKAEAHTPSPSPRRGKKSLRIATWWSIAGIAAALVVGFFIINKVIAPHTDTPMALIHKADTIRPISPTIAEPSATTPHTKAPLAQTAVIGSALSRRHTAISVQSAPQESPAPVHTPPTGAITDTTAATITNTDLAANTIPQPTGAAPDAKSANSPTTTNQPEVISVDALPITNTNALRLTTQDINNIVRENVRHYIETLRFDLEIDKYKLQNPDAGSHVLVI